MLLATGRFCAVDLETTGLNPQQDEIIAFAGIPMLGSRIAVHEGYYTLVRPEKYKLETMKFHGISKDDLGGAPYFGEVAPGILKALDGIIVGHSVEYDHEFLRRHFKRIGTRLKKKSGWTLSVSKNGSRKSRAGTAPIFRSTPSCAPTASKSPTGTTQWPMLSAWRRFSNCR